MKRIDHDKEVRRLTVQHTAEKAALFAQIEQMKGTIEWLRSRAQEAERKVVEVKDLWWSEETGAIPDYELADHERPVEHHGEWY